MSTSAASSRERYYQRIHAQLDSIRKADLWKAERVIAGPQGPEVAIRLDADGGRVQTCLNFCANNYLGMSDHPAVVQAAKDGLDRFGFGMSSVRFICGTSAVHRQLEAALSRFFGKEGTMLFASCFDANTGILEVLCQTGDVIVSDTLIHASLIDGLRLTKNVTKLRYDNNNMASLRAQMEKAKKAVAAQAGAGGGGQIFILLDGVFSMDGVVADVKSVCDIADEFGALVICDDSHGSGVLGAGGRGAPEAAGVLDRVDILTTTLGKALGGAAGGCVCARKPVIDLLRQRARTSLFSNALPPSICAATLKVLEIVQSEEGARLRGRLAENARYFRHKMELAGFTIAGGGHPITPIMCEGFAPQLAQALFRRGIFVTAFSFPVVPRGQARVRVQLSAAMTRLQLDRAIRAFVAAAVEVGLLQAEGRKPELGVVSKQAKL